MRTSRHPSRSSSSLAASCPTKPSAARSANASPRQSSRAATVGEEPLESIAVELAFPDHEHVARRFRHDAAVPERTAHLRHVHPQDAARGCRSRSAPHRLDQRVGRDDLAGAKKKRGQHRPWTSSGELGRPAADNHLHGT
jgi:hypothetical protein